MPEGKDPDDFIKENGKDGLLNLLKKKKLFKHLFGIINLKK